MRRSPGWCDAPGGSFSPSCTPVAVCVFIDCPATADLTFYWAEFYSRIGDMRLVLGEPGLQGRASKRGITR